MGTFRTKLEIDFAIPKYLRGSIRTLQLSVVASHGCRLQNRGGERQKNDCKRLIKSVLDCKYSTGYATVIEGDCDMMSLRSLSQQLPVKYVKCDRFQQRIEPVTQDLLSARDTATQVY